MPKIIIFAPTRQDAILWYAKRLAESDPDGVVIVTTDFSLDQATGILEQMQSLADDQPEAAP